MHIPTHQIHNVLNAYARRLKQKHDAENGKAPEKSEDRTSAYSAEDKRRFIINKISADIVDKIIRTRPLTRENEQDVDSGGKATRKTEFIRYNILNKQGEKISARMGFHHRDAGRQGCQLL